MYFIVPAYVFLGRWCRAVHVSVPSRRLGICRCIATPTEEKTGLFLTSVLSLSNLCVFLSFPCTSQALVLFSSLLISGCLFDSTCKLEIVVTEIYKVNIAYGIHRFCCEDYKTKVSRNANIAKLQAGYLFPEVCFLCNLLQLYPSDLRLISCIFIISFSDYL